jgi:hypothetical protein
MTDELAGYRRLIDLSLEILHLDDCPELQVDLTLDLLGLVTELDLKDDISGGLVAHMTEESEAGDPPTTLALVGFRDRVISLGMERARDLGQRLEWTRDLEDPSVSTEALRQRVIHFSSERIGNSEAALELLIGIESLQSGD